MWLAIAVTFCRFDAYSEQQMCASHIASLFIRGFLTGVRVVLCPSAVSIKSEWLSCSSRCMFLKRSDFASVDVLCENHVCSVRTRLACGSDAVHTSSFWLVMSWCVCVVYVPLLS